jgi:hypothetical protein
MVARVIANADMEAAIAVAERIRTRIMAREMKRRSTGENLGTIRCRSASRPTPTTRAHWSRGADACLL